MNDADDTEGIDATRPSGRMERAIAALADGGQILLRPQTSRNLPPFVVASADRVTSAVVERLAELGQGQIYLTLSYSQCERLQLETPAGPSAIAYNQVDAIDAREGIGTGLSAEDRAHTIHLASSPAATAQDFVKPGHVVPLRAARHGVLERAGPTEAAVDLMRAANRGEGAVIAPLLDTRPSRRGIEPENLVEVGIDEVIAFRWKTDRLLLLDATAALPTSAGDFRVVGFQEIVTGDVHLAFINGDPAERRQVLVSTHRECLLGSHLRGRLCNCAARLEEAIARTQAEGGVLIYSQIPPRARRENPLSSCSRARSAAGEGLPAPQPSVEPHVVAQILRELKIESVRWLGEPPTDPDLELTVSELLPYSEAADVPTSG